MKVQNCADEFSIDTEFDELDWSIDHQAKIIKRQMDFQTLVGSYDSRLKDFGKKTFCLPRRVIHHLDMGVQEASEAWDMVEGGWKHHKSNPVQADKDELLMELVDVMHFVVNAYLFMGGQPERELVAKVTASAMQVQVPAFGLDFAWALAERNGQGPNLAIYSMFSHADGAHGEDWEKKVAARINYLRQLLVDTAAAIRQQILVSNGAVNPHKFPPGSGFIYFTLMPEICACAQAIPGVKLDHLYYAFMHKNDINFKRQKDGY
jgi:hypothetical protein